MLHTCVILLTLRPDALPAVVSRLASEWLGGGLAAPRDMSLPDRADEFGVTAPLLLLQAPGVDAVGAVGQLAAAKGAAALLRVVALGEGYTSVRRCGVGGGRCSCVRRGGGVAARVCAGVAGAGRLSFSHAARGWGCSRRPPRR